MRLRSGGSVMQTGIGYSASRVGAKSEMILHCYPQTLQGSARWGLQSTSCAQCGDVYSRRWSYGVAAMRFRGPPPGSRLGRPMTIERNAVHLRPCSIHGSSASLVCHHQVLQGDFMRSRGAAWRLLAMAAAVQEESDGRPSIACSGPVAMRCRLDCSVT